MGERYEALRTQKAEKKRRILILNLCRRLKQGKVRRKKGSIYKEEKQGSQESAGDPLSPLCSFSLERGVRKQAQTEKTGKPCRDEKYGNVGCQIVFAQDTCIGIKKNWDGA